MNDLSNSPEGTAGARPGISEHELRCDLAAVFRLSVRLGLNAGMGNHISVMLPGFADRFLVNARGLLFQEVTAGNLLVVDLEGHVLSGGRPVRSVTYNIHAPIHRRHPAAKAVVHLHPPHLTALSMIEGGRLTLSHHDNLIVNDRIVYDDAATGPANDTDEGARLADVLGDKTVMVMANHGVLSVGPTIEEAFHELTVCESVCGYQLEAMSTGLRLRRQPDALKWNFCGRWGDLLDARMFLDAWRRILDRTEPDYKDM